MQVAAFHKHPEEVGHHKIIVDSGNAPTPGFIAFMYVVVYHLEQKPHHISQDERGDQIPVDNIPKASDTPQAQEKHKGNYKGPYWYTVPQVVYDEGNLVMVRILPLVIQNRLTLRVVYLGSPCPIAQALSVGIFCGVVFDPIEELRAGSLHQFPRRGSGPAGPDLIRGGITVQTVKAQERDRETL